MPISHMNRDHTPSAVEDVEFLSRSPHRVTALVAMADQSRTRADLLELTGKSSPTIGRTLREFENRRWIERDGHEFATTELGEFVAGAIRELIERIEAERTLREVWQWLPTEAEGFQVEMGVDAVVTTATTEEPYSPVNRFSFLLEETDRFRFVGYDLGVLEPCRDELAERIVDGMAAEIVDPPNLARYVRTTYDDHCADAIASGNLTVAVHDDLPAYGVCLFDDRIAIIGNDTESGTVKVLLDTASPDARTWAEATYESYRRDARPLELESTVA